MTILMTNRMNAFNKILIISLFLIGCQNAANKDKNQIKTFNLKELPEITMLSFLI